MGGVELSLEKAEKNMFLKVKPVEILIVLM